MTERNKQALLSFVVGLLLIEIPVVIDYLVAVPQPPPAILFAGLLGGLGMMLKRYAETRPNGVAMLHQETYERVAPPASLLDDPQRRME